MFIHQVILKIADFAYWVLQAVLLAILDQDVLTLYEFVYIRLHLPNIHLIIHSGCKDTAWCKDVYLLAFIEVHDVFCMVESLLLPEDHIVSAQIESDRIGLHFIFNFQIE